MTHTAVNLIIIVAAAIVLAFLAVVTASIRSGWVVFQVSAKVVPPWQRKAPDKPAPKAATAPEPASNGTAGPRVISEGRKAGAA